MVESTGINNVVTLSMPLCPNDAEKIKEIAKRAESSLVSREDFEWVLKKLGGALDELRIKEQEICELINRIHRIEEERWRSKA